MGQGEGGIGGGREVKKDQVCTQVWIDAHQEPEEKANGSGAGMPGLDRTGVADRTLYSLRTLARLRVHQGSCRSGFYVERWIPSSIKTPVKIRRLSRLKNAPRGVIRRDVCHIPRCDDVSQVFSAERERDPGRRALGRKTDNSHQQHCDSPRH